jgi:DNA-binding response OmpR family regulator
VVALTAFSDARHRDLGASQGFAGYISKPIGADELARELSKVLARVGRPGPRKEPAQEEAT